VRQELTACWIAVTNAGGAAGFPFPPVDASHVAPAVDALAARLDPELGWQVTGRWPGKLRLSPGDTRDEILMILTPL
jgi:hypothetical protein